MSKLKWLDAYHPELKDKRAMGEIEWRFDCLAKYVIEKGLGYPSRLVRKEKKVESGMLPSLPKSAISAKALCPGQVDTEVRLLQDQANACSC